MERPPSHAVSALPAAQYALPSLPTEPLSPLASIPEPCSLPRVMTVPATAIYFTAYDQLKVFLCDRALTSDLLAPMVAGALARCEQSLGCSACACWGEGVGQAPGSPMLSSPLSFHSGHRDCGQSLGAGADKIASPAGVLSGAGQVRPNGRGTGWLALAVAGLGSHCPSGCALLR